jgi:hypothetical protein
LIKLISPGVQADTLVPPLYLPMAELSLFQLELSCDCCGLPALSLQYKVDIK